MEPLNQITIHETLGQFQRGGGSSEELTRELIAVIKRVDPAICGYLSVDEDDALRQARQSDRLRASGVEKPLLGVPLAIKDILNVAGQSCTCASRILRGYRSPYDATVIARLREAGAVLLGRTNMDEFAMGSSTENSAFGPTRNPWDIERVPGGSSGGSAAVVAAGEAVAALGTDTGGSIRQPAAFCGIVGLKPSYGRISRYGLTAFASSLDQIGPMTKDVRDAAILLSVMAGLDPLDSTSIDQPVPDYQAALACDLRGVRAGVMRELSAGGLDPEVERSVQAAVRQCEKLGAQLVEIDLPNIRYAIPVYYIIATAEASANLARFDGVRYGYRAEGGVDPIDMYGKTRAEGFGAEVKRRIILGTYVLSSGYYDAYYLRAQKVRTLIRRDFETAFERCDIILGPVAPTAAYRIGENIGDPLKMYLGDIFTVPVNLAGNCALSVPCGFTAGGLPVGLQMIGPAFGEERIIRVAHAYEQSTEWRRMKPPERG